MKTIALSLVIGIVLVGSALIYQVDTDFENGVDILSEKIVELSQSFVMEI